MSVAAIPCPGCRLELPPGAPPYSGYFHASPECWSVFGEVLAAEFGNAPLFGRVHQMTVDSYAVQHAGGPHPDKSVCVHLVGLHLVLERGISSMDVPRHLQRLASSIASWPHFEPPSDRGSITVFDVASATSPVEHDARVREWAREVWRTWGAHHAAVADVARACFGARRRAAKK